MLSKTSAHSLGRKVRKTVVNICKYTLLITMSFVVLYPLLYMISNAFKPYMQTYDPAVIWIPKSLTLENIVDAVKVLDMGKALTNSALTAVITSFIQVAVCLITGYDFARFNFRLRKFLFPLVLLTMIVPQQTISTSLYTTYRYFGIFGHQMSLIDSYWVFWLPALLGMGLRSGLYIFIYRQFFQSMPHELEEAAEIDGCNPVGTFLKVMLPNAGTVIITVLLFSLVWNWNDYYTPAMFMKNHNTMATALPTF